MNHAYALHTIVTWSWPILQRHGTGEIIELAYDFGCPEYPIYVVRRADETEVILDSWYTIAPVEAGRVAA